MKTVYGCAVIVSGPSGVGKSTLLGEVRKFFPDFGFSVSCTTRPPRGNEQHGVEYYFLDKTDFENRIANNEFAEYAKVFDNYYGTLKQELLTPVCRGKNVFLDIDVQGAMQIKEACLADPMLNQICEFVFIAPPSLDVLRMRLLSRATDSTAQQELRLSKAKNELSYANSYSYIVVNDNIQIATTEFCNLICSFKLSTKRRKWED